jgi:hypothetical protein
MPLALPADAWEIKATQPPRGQGSSALVLSLKEAWMGAYDTMWYDHPLVHA